MGFSVRVAPGVRVRATSRGLRTSIGPRAARIHVGAGGSGFSTRAGPFSYYTGASSSRRSTSGGTSRALAMAQKAEEGQGLAAAIESLLNLHREAFPLAQRPVAPPPTPVDVDAVMARHRDAALRGLGIFKRAARAAAKQAASAAAQAEIEQTCTQIQGQRDAYQHDLDTMWARLQAGDPETVMGVLANAFEDNDAAAAPVGVDGTEASIVVLVPPPSALPDRKPTLTAAGNPSLKKLTKAELAALYSSMVSGYVLVTAKEAFAVAPPLTTQHLVAVRASERDAFGDRRVEALMGVTLHRETLDRVKWDTSDAETVIEDAGQDLLRRTTGRSADLAPLDLTAEPAIAALVQAIDIDELAEA